VCTYLEFQLVDASISKIIGGFRTSVITAAQNWFCFVKSLILLILLTAAICLELSSSDITSYLSPALHTHRNVSTAEEHLLQIFLTFIYCVQCFITDIGLYFIVSPRYIVQTTDHTLNLPNYIRHVSYI